MVNNSAFLAHVRKLKRDVHSILIQSEVSSHLMNEPFERLLDASKKFKQMDDKDPDKKKIEEMLCHINNEISCHQEKDDIYKKFPDLIDLPKTPHKRL